MEGTRGCPAPPGGPAGAGACLGTPKRSRKRRGGQGSHRGAALPPSVDTLACSGRPRRASPRGALVSTPDMHSPPERHGRHPPAGAPATRSAPSCRGLQSGASLPGSSMWTTRNLSDVTPGGDNHQPHYTPRRYSASLPQGAPGSF